MMKSRAILGLLLGCLLVVAGSTSAEDKPAEAKALCPVSGKPANMSVSSDYHGGKLYFCCKGCVAPFNDDTAKFAAKANEQLVVTGQATQTACPLTGRPVNAEKKADVGGVEVCFCCGGCLGKVSKLSADEQVELVFGKGFDKGFTVKKASE